MKKVKTEDKKLKLKVDLYKTRMIKLKYRFKKSHIKKRVKYEKDRSLNNLC